MKDGNHQVCVVEDFITRDTELISAMQVANSFSKDDNHNLYEHYISCLEKLGLGNEREKVDKMIVVDYILANQDKHWNNFGIIRNVVNGQVLKVVPIYDTGCSLWYGSHKEQIGLSFKAKPFCDDELEQLALVKDFSWLDIKKLDGFLEEVRDILSLNSLSSKERNDNIIFEIE